MPSVTTSEQEVKPCPFCGGSAVITDVRESHHSFKVGCYSDTCWQPGTGYFDTEQEAIAAWNKRSPDIDRERAAHQGHSIFSQKSVKPIRRRRLSRVNY